MSKDKIVKANGVDICVETFGDPVDPPILLIQGMGGSMLWWEDEFCERLAAGSRFVIRYDNRDTGRSITYPPGAPGYTATDLPQDATGLLDTLGLPKAHVVGISMGAGIAKQVAVHHPDRVTTLTLISFSPAPGDPDLPPTSEEAIANFSRAEPDWTDRAAVIDYLVADSRAFAAHSLPFDDAAVRDLVTRDVDRAVNIASIVNHGIMVSGDDETAADLRKSLGELTVDTLVLHGTEDPLFPYGHGIALAKEIPNARLVPMEHTGHEVPKRVWDVVVPAIVAHTSEARMTTPDPDEYTRRLAAESLAVDDPTGWFENLYVAAESGEVRVPWDRGPHPLVVRWAQDRALVGDGRRAMVVGSGLGGDAELISGLGFDTVAFDVSATAIRTVRRRFPDSVVRYLNADLLDPPAEWREAFDLVVETLTVQSMPVSMRAQAIVHIGQLVGPGGTLIVHASVRDEDDGPVQGPPWPLTRTDIDAFGTGGLRPVRIEVIEDGYRCWRAEFHRQGG